MYIERVPNRNSRPALLLREAWREGKTVRKRTVANLTDWPAAKVEALRRVLRGDTLRAAAARLHRRARRAARPRGGDPGYGAPA